MQRNKKYIHRQKEAEKKEDYLKIVQDLSRAISIAGNSRAPHSVKISIFQIYGTYFNASVEQCAKLRGSNQCLTFTDSLWVLLGCSRCPDVLQQTIRMFLFLSKPTELYQEYHLCSQISRVSFIVLSRR